MTMMDIFSSMAEGGVAAYDTKAYAAIKGAKEQEKASERAEKRLEAELSLKEQQIKQAKIKTTLMEDAKKAQRLGQKFAQTDQDPDVAAEMYNSMGYDDEMQFDQAHFESTASGGKRQAVQPKASMAGTTEDRLKPEGQRAGALVGAAGGEYRFKRGRYERNDKGEKIKGQDGKPIFVETGKPVLFKTKQEMVDDTMETTMDPKLRLAMALKDLGIDEFLHKKKFSKEAAMEVDVGESSLKKEEIKLRGEEDRKTARVRGGFKTGTQAKSTKTAERMEVDDFRKGLVEDYNKVMHPDEDGTEKYPFDRKQAKKIMEVEQNPEFKDVFERLKALGPKKAREQNIRLQKLKKAYGLPKGYIDYLKKKLNIIQ